MLGAAKPSTACIRPFNPCATPTLAVEFFDKSYLAVRTNYLRPTEEVYLSVASGLVAILFGLGLEVLVLNAQ